jgi:hypothetical protein
MKSRLAALALLLASSVALADDKAVAACEKTEASARAKCAAELAKAAKSLAGMKAFEEARDELRLAVTIAPQDAALRKELAKLLAQSEETPEAVADKVEAATKAAHTAASAALAPAAVAWDKADRPEELARFATVAMACLGAAAVRPLELVWYEPYVVWARKQDVERWEKGDEFVDGAWIEADKVAALDKRHGTWATPWVISDGIHEIRTNMPLRAAKRVSEYVRAWRRFVVDSFAGEWEWKQPKGPLPVYVTATQADYQARLTAYDPGAAKSRASAIYVQKTGGLCPVFVTFEPKDAVGAKIDWPALLRDVRHETAHQILYESCMAQGAAVGGNIDWVSEGIANYLAAHEPKQGRWRLSRHDKEPYAGGWEPGAFAWTRGHFDKAPPLSQYFTEFKPNLEAADDYFVATTVMYFLLQGAEGRYRPGAVKLLVEVHMAKGGPGSVAACFGKLDYAKMQEEWKSFVQDISIETRK